MPNILDESLLQIQATVIHPIFGHRFAQPNLTGCRQFGPP
jgi:hypothetical protein